MRPREPRNGTVPTSTVGLTVSAPNLPMSIRTCRARGAQRKCVRDTVAGRS